MNKDQNIKLVVLALEAAVAAGREIMKIYREDYKIEKKEDSSPVTTADLNADRIIQKTLLDGSDDIPVLSEETFVKATHSEYKSRLYWLVDPLDGTKEFIKKNDEFSINIACIEDNEPSIGVVYAPAKDVAYIGLKDYGSYRLQARALQRVIDLFGKKDPSADHHLQFWRELENGLGTKLPSLKPLENSRSVTVAVSNSHMSDDTQRFIDMLKPHYSNVDIVSSGGALKVCWIADGSVDVYPRFTETKEWDTAAGHAICLSVGADIEMWPEGTRLRYNKSDISNPSFVARRPEIVVPGSL